MNDQGFHIRNVGKQREQFQIINKFFRYLSISFDLKRKNRAAALWKIFFI